MRALCLILAAAGAVLGEAPGRQQRTVFEAEVLKVHESAIIIDTHNDVTSATGDGLALGVRRTDGHTDLPRLKEGGVGATCFAVFVAGNYVEGNHAANRTLHMIDTVRHDIIERHPKDFEFVTTADGIVAAHKKGKFAAPRCSASKADMPLKTACACCATSTRSGFAI